MKKFMVIYHAPAEDMKQNEDVSEEDMKKGMEQWMLWAEKCGDSLVDFGNPLAGGMAISPGGGSMPSDKSVVGYSVLQAENMTDAQGLLEGHPHLNWTAGCQIEVHEMMPPPGQS